MRIMRPIMCFGMQFEPIWLFLHGNWHLFIAGRHVHCKVFGDKKASHYFKREVNVTKFCERNKLHTLLSRMSYFLFQMVATRRKIVATRRATSRRTLLCCSHLLCLGSLYHAHNLKLQYKRDLFRQMYGFYRHILVCWFAQIFKNT